jgi:hypothetical protein
MGSTLIILPMNGPEKILYSTGLGQDGSDLFDRGKGDKGCKNKKIKTCKEGQFCSGMTHSQNV